VHPRVVALTGMFKGESYRLTGAKLTLGRDNSNSVQIGDATVSKKHCAIEAEGDRFELVDLESHNGTFVNGIPVTRRALMHGDVIRVGNSELLFLTREESQDDAVELQYSDDVTQEALKTVQITVGSQTHSPTDVGRMARDLNALFKIANTINSIRDPGHLQTKLLELIFEVVPAEVGAILLMSQVDEEPRAAHLHERRPGAGPTLRIRRNVIQRALWERASVFTETSSSDVAEGENIMCVPLIGVQNTIGTIYLTSRGLSAQFAENHVQFLNSAAGIAAVTLENVFSFESLKEENRRLRQVLEPSETIIGESKAMRRLGAFIDKVAKGDSTVLIRGESGTGKELVARAIHVGSARAEKPFVAINCAAIPETLLESELFGNEKGAFTGAVFKKGKLEAAEDGTVFLDEIGELAPLLQAKLLRVLQQREFDRLGGTRPIKFQARVLAATNKNLEQAIKEGEFRQDLFYRLNVVSTTVPPLREHRDDIPLLAIYFATKYAEKSERPFKGISSEARTILMSYDWPGNVRELENAIEHAIVMGSVEEVLPEDLPETLMEKQSVQVSSGKYHHEINELKKRLIIDAVTQAKGSYIEAAKLLGVHPNYLHRLIRNLEIKDMLRAVEST
jgi:transcriptional regulator with PAS, ATPase and Fis domain/pSer/pThr/pTyr-binding forkhead associated (FHA) protein